MHVTLAIGDVSSKLPSTTIHVSRSAIPCTPCSSAAMTYLPPMHTLHCTVGVGALVSFPDPKLRCGLITSPLREKRNFWVWKRDYCGAFNKQNCSSLYTKDTDSSLSQAVFTSCSNATYCSPECLAAITALEQYGAAAMLLVQRCCAANSPYPTVLP